MRFHVSPLNSCGRKYTRESNRTAPDWLNARQRELVPAKRQFRRASRFVAIFCQIDRKENPPVTGADTACLGENQPQPKN
jgi:hypothetical protein